MGDSGDFIFARNADGILEFKGDFEGLYQSDPDPWGQSGEHPRMKEYYARSRWNLVDAMALERRTNLKWNTALEVGCGVGYITHLLSVQFRACKVTGMDISPTAIKCARELFPLAEFWVGDIAEIAAPQGEGLGKRYDVVILSQMLWYILDRLPRALGNAQDLVSRGGCLVIQNAFLDNQEYGREIVDGFNGLLKYVLDHHADDFQVVNASYDASSRFAPYHDGLLALQSKW